MRIAAIGVAVAMAWPGLAMAQAAKPDLTGIWTNTSITNLTRGAGQPKLVVTQEEAAAIVRSNSNVRRAESDARPTDPNAPAPTDRNTAVGFNAGWMDPGYTVGQVRGEYRTSWIVDPENGQLPLTDAGRTAQREAPARQRNATNPENMAPNDRCLIGSRGSGGPGMLNNLYNNTYQIVQSKDHVAIWVEMVHDVRIVPIFATKAQAQASHRPPEMHPWLGDSVGWWEGKTFVVETTNVHPEQGGYGPIFLSEKGKVTERFVRDSDKALYYAFEVEDPVYYTRPWKAEMGFNVSPGLIYEYACHEGNYAMEAMLAGARQEEAAAAARTGVR